MQKLDDRLKFKDFPKWIAHARSAGVSGIDELRGIKPEWADEPRRFLDEVVWPQLDWLDANDLPLALMWDHPYGTNVDEKMDFDGRIEALQTPALHLWCDTVPSMIEAVAVATDMLMIYGGTLVGDDDMMAARKRDRSEYTARVIDSLDDYHLADVIAFDQVCQLRPDDPIFRDLQRIRKWLGKPCLAESRPRMDTIAWAEAGWGFTFTETHLFLDGPEWYPLSLIRELYGLPIARMTIGVPAKPNEINPATGQKWTAQEWGDFATRRIRADGDTVVRGLGKLKGRGLTVRDFE